LDNGRAGVIKGQTKETKSGREKIFSEREKKSNYFTLGIKNEMKK